MLHPRSYATGSTLVTRLVTHALGTERRHPEDVIHTVLLHADGRCDYPKTYGGFKRREGTPKRVSIRTVRGTYESPPHLITPNGAVYWTEKDLLDGRKTGPRSPRGTVPERVRLTTFALWREHSKLPDLYREIVEIVDREVTDWLPGFGWLPTLSAIRSAAQDATDAGTLLERLTGDWRTAELRYRTHFGGTAGNVVGAKFSHACQMVEALVKVPAGDLFHTLTDDPTVLDAHAKLHARLHEWSARVNALLAAESGLRRPTPSDDSAPLEDPS